MTCSSPAILRKRDLEGLDSVGRWTHQEYEGRLGGELVEYTLLGS